MLLPLLYEHPVRAIWRDDMDDRAELLERTPKRIVVASPERSRGMPALLNLLAKSTQAALRVLSPSSTSNSS